MTSDRERALKLLRGASNNATDEGYAGVMCIVTDGTDTVTFPSIAGDVDPRMASIWMLGAHIKHVSDAAESAGGELSMAEAASHAIAFVEEYGSAEDAGI